MIALILFIIFGLAFGYFATLNTDAVSVYFGTASVNDIPMYILVLASVGLGILFATLFYFIKSIGTNFVLGRKGKEIGEAKQEIAKLTKTIHQLELENTRLKTQTGELVEDDDSI